MNWFKIANKNKCSGWAAVRLSRSESAVVQKWGRDNISDEMLYNKKKEQGKQTDFGRELDTHITVLYGICTDKVELLKTLLKDQKKIKATLQEVGFFKHPDGYEPLIIKVESNDLEKLHNKIKDHLRVETTFNKYKPHCTIAYVKQGEAMKFAGDRSFYGTKLSFDKIVFVSDKNEEIEIKLK